MSRTASKPATDSTSRKTSDVQKTAKLSDSPSNGVLKESHSTPSPAQNRKTSKQPTSNGVDTKKIPRRASKPIINWFQRKLASRPRRASEGSPTPLNATAKRGAAQPIGNGQSKQRVVSTPPAALSLLEGNGSAKEVLPAISLNDTEPRSSEGDRANEDRSTYASSAARDSEGANGSAIEADEDASVRPLPPSSPPSPTGSRSSASYLSDPHTFRSLAASTKPTTVLSVDLAPAGVAHIAQAPPTPSQGARAPLHARQSSTGTGQVGSGGSITFSALPPSPNSSSRPTSPSRDGVNGNEHVATVQAPLHTAHHPRNNPRPSSPPMDNASMLTLASSAFAFPGARSGMGARAGSTAPSGLGAGDSVSHFGGSLIEPGDAEESSRYGDGDESRLENDVELERDVNASMRALRPRSSRQGSWGSEMSGWSAKIGGTGAGTSLAGKSLWTNGSIKTGGQFSLDGTESLQLASPTSPEVPPPAIQLTTESRSSPVSLEPDTNSAVTSPVSPAAEASAQHTEDQAIHHNMKVNVNPNPPNAAPAQTAYQGHEGDNHSIAATDNQTDFWVSAPTTPIA